MSISFEEKLTEVELAAIASVWRRPDSVIEQRPGWFQITTPSSKQLWFNGVVQSKLSDKEAPELVAKTIEKFRSLGCQFRWRLSPSSTPKHLGKILESHGMKHLSAVLGMAAEIENLKIKTDPHVSVEKIGLHNIEEYVRACVLGWNTPDAEQEMLADMHRSITDPSHPTLYFLARYKGQLAASGGLLPLKKSGYLLGTSVVPEYRNKGIYRSFVAERCRVLREMNIDLVTIQAVATTSAPICSKLGFETVSEMQVYLG